MLFLFQTSGIINLSDLQLIAPELILTVVACVALGIISLTAWNGGRDALDLGRVGSGEQPVDAGRRVVEVLREVEVTVEVGTPTS